jgi:hypothetical protein
MRKRLLAVVSIVALLTMESMTVFATETGTGTGRPSPNSSDVLTGNAGDTVETTNEQVATVNAAVTAKVEVKETKTNDDGSKTTQVHAGIKDIQGLEITIEVTQRLDNVIQVNVSDGTKNEYVDQKDEKIIYSTTAKTKAEIAPADNMTQMETLTETKKIESTAKATAVVNELRNIGAEAESVTIGDFTGDVDEKGGWNLRVEGAKIGDSFLVMHDNNGWGQSKAWVTKDNNLYIQSGSKSPFIIIKLDKNISGITTTEVDTDYTQPNASLTNGETGTVSGYLSPKTEEAEPYKAVAALALIAIAGVAVCSRKITNK